MSNDRQPRQRVAAVVAVPYYLDKPEGKAWERLLRNLDEMLGTGLDAIVVVADQKTEEKRDKPSHEVARKAVARKRRAARKAGVKLAVERADVWGTGNRWYPGFLRAFTDRHLNADVAVCYPADIEPRAPATTAGVIQKLKEKAGGDKLVLGDYESSDPFKTSFDGLITKALLGILYPEDLCRRILELGMTKLRAELFALGRRVFNSFRELSTVRWDMDPTLFLTVHAVGTKGFKVQTERLGHIGDDDKWRNPVMQVEQIVRLASQLLKSRITPAGNETAGPYEEKHEEQLACYDRLRREVEAAFKVILEAIDTNRKRIEPGRATPASRH